SIGMSKLGWFVKLKTSKVYFSENRSVICVVFRSDTSARFCQACRKILRCPPLGMKLVSKVSPGGIAPPKSPGFSKGRVKHEAFRAGELGLLPMAPVTAFCGVHPDAKGTMGFVIPSLML